MISIPSYPPSLPGSASRSASPAVGGHTPSADTVIRSGRSGLIRTPEDAINVMRLRLQQQIEASMGASGQAPERYGQRFEAPSAAQVADTIVGFVQQRLQSEQRDGAGDSRLADLLFSAGQGIALGFEQARAEIDAMGLMSDALAADIDQSRERVSAALASLKEHFLGVTADQPANATAGDVEPSAGR